MDRQQGRKPMRRMRDSPEMQRMPDRDRMSPGSDRYDGRGGAKMGGRVRSMERDDSSRRGTGDRRPPRDDYERPQSYNNDRPQNFQNDGFQRKEPDCLRITNFPSHVSDTAIRDALFHEFKKYGEVNVRVVFSQAKNERIAYVRFRLPDQARDAMQARGDRLTLFARPLHIVAIVNKTNHNQGQGHDGGFMNSNRQNDFQGRGRQHGGSGGMQGKNYRQDMGSSGGGGGGRGGRDRDFNRYDSNSRNYGGNDGYQNQGRDRDRDATFLPEDDPKATRTVFCGNLEDGIQESEIRRHFERYGFVEEIDIKYPPRGQGNPFAFVKFENLDMAYKAIISMSGQYIGRNQCKTGYGKQSPTNCLWVGGLGPWITLGVLEREFDRFGAIRKIDYIKGDAFAYISYETVEAAQAAASHMRGIPLGGPDKRLRVDFAEHGPGIQTTKKPFRAFQGPSNNDDGPGGRGYNRYNNQDRDIGRDISPPNFRDGPDQWQGGGGGGGGFDGQSRGNWQSGNNKNKNDNWNRRDNDQPGRIMQRNDNRKRRNGSPDDFASRDDWSPSNAKASKRRKSPGGDWSPERRKPRDSSNARDWDASPDGRVRHQRSISSDLSDQDFSSQPVERRRKRGRRSRIPDSLNNLSDLVSCLSMSWRGHLVLKNSAFATRMFLVGGDADTAEALLPHNLGSDESALRITQRLRLDQPKLDEVTKRISQAGSGGHAILLSMTGTSDDSDTLPSGTQPRALVNLVTYLTQKKAAGVISLPVSGEQNKDNVGVLHAFPPCEFSHKFLLDIAPGLGPDPCKEDHLVVIIVKGAA